MRLDDDFKLAMQLDAMANEDKPALDAQDSAWVRREMRELGPELRHERSAHAVGVGENVRRRPTIGADDGAGKAATALNVLSELFSTAGKVSQQFSPSSKPTQQQQLAEYARLAEMDRISKERVQQQAWLKYGLIGGGALALLGVLWLALRAPRK